MTPRISSSSSMEALLKCPKYFAYTRALHIPDNTFSNKNYGQWLDALYRGSFFHSIMEKYCGQKMCKPSSERYDEFIDEAFLSSLASEIENNMISELPYAFRSIADQDTGDLIAETRVYLNKLIVELNGQENWRILAEELGFENSQYLVTDYAGNAHVFTISGIIDRVDYRVDPTEKKCYLRIIDYKTGKRDSKEKEKRRGTVVQYDIYKKALMGAGIVKGGNISLLDRVKHKITESEKNEEIKDYEFIFDSFQYVFPLDNETDKPIEIKEIEADDISLIRMKTILTLICDGKVYSDKKQLFDAISEMPGKFSKYATELNGLKCAMAKTKKINEINDEEKKDCRYCEYKELCVSRKAGDLG